MSETITFVDIYRGIDSFPGFGGANWFSCSISGPRASAAFAQARAAAPRLCDVTGVRGDGGQRRLVALWVAGVGLLVVGATFNLACWKAGSSLTRQF